MTAARKRIWQKLLCKFAFILVAFAPLRSPESGLLRCRKETAEKIESANRDMGQGPTQLTTATFADFAKICAGRGSLRGRSRKRERSDIAGNSCQEIGSQI